MSWTELELVPLLDLLEVQSKDWASDDVLLFTQNLGVLIKKQLEKFNDGVYRTDRNEILGFFDAIEKFSITQLPISLEHFQALIDDYRKRILPYPHYSGIAVKVPSELLGLENLENLVIPKS